MELNISLTEKQKNTLFFSTLFLVFFLSFLVRFLMYIKIKTFILSSDVLYHALLTKMIIVQKTPLIFWEDGSAVNYPIGFHTLSALVSFIFDIPSFRSVWAVFITLTALQVIIAYFLGKEMGGRYIGLASAFFFGMGLFPWTPFLYAGMYANVFGQILAMLLLFAVVKYNLYSVKISVLCSVLLGVLIMTHSIALSSFILSFISFLLIRIAFKKELYIRNILLFLLCGLIVSIPWLLHIAQNIISGFHTLTVPFEFAIVTPRGFLGALFYVYRYFLIFAPIGIYVILKKFEKGAFVIIWAILLFGLTYTRWGNRFGMEMYVPLNFLGAFGLVEMVEILWKRIGKVKIDSIIWIFIIGIFLIDTVDLLFFQLTGFKTEDVAEANLEALEWIKKNTREDEIFYASTVSSYIGYIIVYADRKVLNFFISTSAEPSVISPSEKKTLKEIRKMEMPDVFGGNEFYSLLLKHDVTYIYVFNKRGKTEWYDPKIGKSTVIFKTDILGSRNDLYEVVFENEFVKIYKIKKEKSLWNNDHKLIARCFMDDFYIGSTWPSQGTSYVKAPDFSLIPSRDSTYFA